MTDLSNPGTIPIFARSFGSWELTLRRHPLNRAEIVRDYDAASSGWHQSLERLGVTEAYAGIWSEALDLRGETGAVRLLDCGIGSGAFAAALADQTEVHISGIDLSPGMVAAARARLACVGVTASVAVGSVTALDAPNNQFDITSAAHVLEHLPDPHLGLAEMARVTRPGGFVVACLTTTSFAGRLIALRWRTHCFSVRAAGRIFEAAELCPLRFIPVGRSPTGPLSIAVIAQKPV